MSHNATVARRAAFLVTATAIMLAGMMGLGEAEAGASPLNHAERRVVAKINMYRARHGLPQLRVNRKLTRAAEWMARDMGRHRRFGHIDSRGRDPFARIAAFGYPTRNTWRGENLAAGRASAGSAFQQWRHSPSHDANMRDRRFRAIGVARVRVPGSPYGWYWATTFGSRR